METRIQVAAGIQLVAGALNVLLMSWLTALFWFSAGGVSTLAVMTLCTLGLCPLPFGIVCSAVGPVIFLVGILEFVGGLAGLIRPDTARPLALGVAVIGVLSLFLANPVSVVAGVVVLAILATPAASQPGDVSTT